MKLEMREERPVLCVAALTFRRPEMLAVLLERLRALERPPGWDVRFLVVDNDPEASARPVVQRFAPSFGEGRLAHVLEPEPGIPFARNRALDEALAEGARLLCFLDDDEVPAAGWLRELMACRHATGAVLVGGPVRVLPPDYPTGTWRAFLARSLVARSAQREASCARIARTRGSPNIATNNWMGDLEWIWSEGLRFDTAFSRSGAEDTAFYREVRARGGPVAWCDRAVVWEHLPPDRLSVRYQLRRFRSHGLNLARLRGGSAFRTSVSQSARMAAGVALMVVPVLGIGSFMLGVHLVGVGMGWFAGLLGARSDLYLRREGGA